MPEIDPNELRRLRRLESRLEKANEKTKADTAEKRELKRRLSSAEKLAERTEKAEAESREARQTLDAERKQSADSVHAAERRALSLSKQVDGLIKENRRLAEQIESISADLESLRGAGEEARQAIDAARAEATEATEARSRVEEENRALTAERDRLLARVETSEAQLEQEGQTTILPAEEVTRIVGDLVNDLRGSLPGLNVREGEVKLKVAFGGAGERSGFVIPTIESGPEVRETLNELTLRFE